LEHRGGSARNGVFTEGGSWPHIWVGYALAGMLVLRLLWGLVGPREARFSAFPPSLPRALAHIREIKAGKVHDQPSHNPLGALMVYAIWGTLGIIIASGIAMAGLPPKAVTHDHHGVEQAALSMRRAKMVKARKARWAKRMRPPSTCSTC
jgi:cytochrome b